MCVNFDYSDPSLIGKISSFIYESEWSELFVIFEGSLSSTQECISAGVGGSVTKQLILMFCVWIYFLHFYIKLRLHASKDNIACKEVLIAWLFLIQSALMLGIIVCPKIRQLLIA